MIARIEPETARAAVLARRLAVFDAVLVAMAWLAHRLDLLETVPFIAVLGLVLAIAGAAIVAWAIGFRRVWYRGDQGAGSLATALLVLAVLAAPGGFALYRAATNPAFVDISTDPDDPPAFAPSAVRTPPMNAIVPPTAADKAEQDEAYPDLTGRRYSLPVERVLDAALALVQARGWMLAGPSPEPALDGDTLVQALAKTMLLSMPVDVSIRLTDEGSATYVDMRSAWRYGPHDLGDNAERISAFLADLDQAVANSSVTPAAE